jgi:hypothetical protein
MTNIDQQAIALSDEIMLTISDVAADRILPTSIVLPAIALTAARVFTLAPAAEFETALQEFLGGVESTAKQLRLEESSNEPKRG